MTVGDFPLTKKKPIPKKNEIKIMCAVLIGDLWFCLFDYGQKIVLKV